MPIDQYEHSFEYLVGTELPQHMVTLEQAMKISMAEFAKAARSGNDTF
jgi:hypothetical protein